MIYKDGYTYNGHWEKNKKNGEGELAYKVRIKFNCEY